MLLTSSQVSAAISSGIVAISTSILFASGYYLQQQSVRNLNAVLHPGGGRRGPWEQLVARAELALESQDASKYRDDGEIGVLEGFIRDDEFNDDDSKEAIDQREKFIWSRRAYVSVVQHPADVCAAVMAVTSLSIQGSPARRVLVHPDHWLVDNDDDGASDFRDAPETQLLRIARAEHLLETVAWSAVKGGGRSPVDSSSESVDINNNSSAIGSFLTGLADFDALLYLQPDGLILNATRLDMLFDDANAGVPTAAVVALNRGVGELVAPAVLVRPHAETDEFMELQLGDDNDKTGSNKNRVDVEVPEELDDEGAFMMAAAAAVVGGSSSLSTLETTRGLARPRDRFMASYSHSTDESELMKMGYVMVSSPVSNLDEEDAGAAATKEEVEEVEEKSAHHGTDELRRRRGGATIPQSVPTETSLVDDFIMEHEKHKEMVCGAMLSIIREEGSDDWAFP